MAKLEYRDPTDSTYRAAKGSDGAVHVKTLEAIADDGTALDTNGARTMTYNGDNTLATISIVHNGHTYTQTFTYTSGNLTSVSGWVKVS